MTRTLVKLGAGLFLVLVFAAMLVLHFQAAESLAKWSFQPIGINDFPQYKIHTLLGELDLWLGLPEAAALQFRKAEPHARNSKERSSALAGKGEALLIMGEKREGENTLIEASIVDPLNERANRILMKLRE
jgi:hypothetical protein